MVISTSLSPNTEKDDIVLALKIIFQPWKWKKGNTTKDLEEQFKKYLGVNHAFAFNSGRSAFMAILESLEVKDKEILLQAFTCNAAVNPILKAKAKPVFVDIDDSLNMDPEDLKKKITSGSRIVIVQHTFGYPAQINEILNIVKESNLILIEDGAHSLGAKIEGKYCGTFGKASFFSFGRDKVISSIYGGIAITNDLEVAEKLKQIQAKLQFPSYFWIFQQLIHPILMSLFILPAYSLNSFLGRIVLGGILRFSILSKSVYKEEKLGKIPNVFPRKFPNGLAILALNQFGKLERYNSHREKIAKLYQKAFNMPENKNAIFMRFPILIKTDTDIVLKKARKRKMYLDDGWRKSVIVPLDTDKRGYYFGGCPQAEKTAWSVLNLPTHINISENSAQEIIKFLKNNKWV